MTGGGRGGGWAGTCGTIEQSGTMAAWLPWPGIVETAGCLYRDCNHVFLRFPFGQRCACQPIECEQGLALHQHRVFMRLPNLPQLQACCTPELRSLLMELGVKVLDEEAFRALL